MPSELRRPRLPELPEWTARMEEQLLAQVRPVRPARTTPRSMERLFRVFRSIARPAGHGIAAFAASMVVVSALSIPAPIEDSTPATIPPDALVEEAAVTPVPAPARSHGFLTLLPLDDAQAVRSSDIEDGVGALTEAPQSNAPAVPTPEGGGWAEATLRPTVR